MGSGSSKQTDSSHPSLRDPFPVTSHLSQDLDRLSFVAARVLSTPDIYDINNLQNPDVCGDYAVFIKKQIMDDLIHLNDTKPPKALKPLLVDLSKTPEEPALKEVVYQSKSSSMKTEERTKICEELAETMVQVITIIIACLASIQVSSDSRKMAVSRVVTASADAVSSSPIVHKGGGVDLVREWLKSYEYIHKEEIAKQGGVKSTHQFNLPVNDVKFYLDFTQQGESSQSTYGHIRYGTLDTIVRCKFLDYIDISNDGINKVLPIIISNNVSGLVYYAGVLIPSKNRGFISFSNSPPSEIIKIETILIGVFSTPPRPKAFSPGEEPSKLFEELLQAPSYSRAALINTRAPHIRSLITKSLDARYQQGFQYQQPGYYPGYPPGMPGLPGLPGYPNPQLKQYEEDAARALRLTEFAFKQQVEKATHHAPVISIPGAAVKNALTGFKDLIPLQSSPAAVRAITLAGVLDADRFVHTNVCKDPYWRSEKRNIGFIYPWATLQFLCMKDLTKRVDKDSRASAGATPSKHSLVVSKFTFHEEWKQFIDELKNTYKDKGPELIVTTGEIVTMMNPVNPVDPTKPSKPTPQVQEAPITLDRIKFGADLRFDVCHDKSGVFPRVKFQEVQTGVDKLNHLYHEHVKKVWALLNSLILLIKDPETNTELVRLHPAVTSMEGGKSSVEYVTSKARECREMLKKFYVEIESTYVNIIGELKPV